MLAPLFGYFFSMITMLTAVVVVLTSFSNISTLGKGRHHLRPPVINRTVTVDNAARQSPVAQETSPAVVSTVKAEDIKKASITSSKWSLVSATTTALGTQWVMPKKPGTAQEVFFSNDAAHGQPAFNASDTNSRYVFVRREDVRCNDGRCALA